MREERAREERAHEKLDDQYKRLLSEDMFRDKGDLIKEELHKDIEKDLAKETKALEAAAEKPKLSPRTPVIAPPTTVAKKPLTPVTPEKVRPVESLQKEIEELALYDKAQEAKVKELLAEHEKVKQKIMHEQHEL